MSGDIESSIPRPTVPWDNLEEWTPEHDEEFWKVAVEGTAAPLQEVGPERELTFSVEPDDGGKPTIFMPSFSSVGSRWLYCNQPASDKYTMTDWETDS